jgi:GNAT superfamily N-acetyltransferase
VSTWLVEEIAVPETLDAPNAADFIAAIDVKFDCEVDTYKSEELRKTAAEILPRWLDEANSPRRLFCVRVDGRIVGMAELESTAATDDDICWVSTAVLPAYRRRGIGTALADHLETVAHEAGRSRQVAYVPSPGDGGPRLPAPSGAGSLPATNPEVLFLLRRGFQLEQVVRASRLALPKDVSLIHAEGYRIHQWTDVTPAHWLDDVAVLITRMSTDAPQGDLGEPEDPWTAARLAEDEERERANPRSLLTTAVEHIASGHLVGFTELSSPAERNRAVSQESTLVLAEHRGHRLGMVLKLANLDYLQRTRSGHPSVITFNAEENRFMLDTNEAVGFVPIGYEGAWKKVRAT